jgi:hypothetical protein
VVIRFDPTTRMTNGDDVLARIDDLVKIDAGIHIRDQCRKEAFGLLLPAMIALHLTVVTSTSAQ